MAIKLGAENKRNVIIAGSLFCVLAFLVIRQLTDGPSAPPPQATAVPRPVAAPPKAPVSTSTASAAAPAAKLISGSRIDLTLHLEKLALSESIDYAGSGRNIFSGESAPVPIETAQASARPEVTAPPVYTPPPVPQPPAIDLRYFGYAAGKDGKRQAFLLRGEDIFEASVGEIVNHRYKVVAVDAHSVQVTDLSYNNTQTLPLTN
jgi:hypothetical protein